MKLGFTRDEANDSVWENEKGTPYFIVFKEVHKNVIFDWDVELRKVHIEILDDNQSIISRFPVKDLQTLSMLIEFFETSKIEQNARFC